jgi:hypothetical protein
VYIHLHPGLSEYTRKSPCIFTLNQNHSCPFLTVSEPPHVLVICLLLKLFYKFVYDVTNTVITAIGEHITVNM